VRVKFTNKGFPACELSRGKFKGKGKLNSGHTLVIGKKKPRRPFTLKEKKGPVSLGCRKRKGVYNEQRRGKEGGERAVFCIGKGKRLVKHPTRGGGGSKPHSSVSEKGLVCFGCKEEND